MFAKILYVQFTPPLLNLDINRPNNLLKEQLLKRFLKMSGNIYPNLVRVFYTNLQFVGNNLVSHVKGVEMEITHEVWTANTIYLF